ncbi:hypothetical protein Mapa_002114 [Marchantia paleacea]|nr:hypothetical protein Mapa_002114 [Marchantia paleacea]
MFRLGRREAFRFNPIDQRLEVILVYAASSFSNLARNVDHRFRGDVSLVALCAGAANYVSKVASGNIQPFPSIHEHEEPRWC